MISLPPKGDDHERDADRGVRGWGRVLLQLPAQGRLMLLYIYIYINDNSNNDNDNTNTYHYN